MYDALVANVYMFYDTSIPLVRDRSNCTTKRIADQEHYAPAFSLFYQINTCIIQWRIFNIQRKFTDVLS